MTKIFPLQNLEESLRTKYLLVNFLEKLWRERRLLRCFVPRRPHHFGRPEMRVQQRRTAVRLRAAAV